VGRLGTTRNGRRKWRDGRNRPARSARIDRSTRIDRSNWRNGSNRCDWSSGHAWRNGSARTAGRDRSARSADHLSRNVVERWHVQFG
jgi:hypothetical protein